MASSPTVAPKLPTAQLTILSICRFAEPVALTGVFPYLPEMIESFKVPHAQVGQWAGILSAVFSISQCLTAIPWGRASDRYGRKPVILFAMFCAMVSSLFFGFSTSLPMAIVARAMSGASNGNVGILRTTVAEMVPQRVLQPKAFATLPLVWQVGSIFGPIIGGGLANPARKLPGLFGENKFLKRFPYAMPNLVSGVIFVIGLCAGVLFLKESLAARKHRIDYGRVAGDWLMKPFIKKRRRELRPADDFENMLPNHHKDQGEKCTPPKYREVFSKQASINLLAYFFLGAHGVTYNQVLPVFLHLPPNHDNVSLPFKFSGGFGLDSGKIGIIFTVFGIVSMLFQFTIFPYTAQRLGSLRCYRGCTFVFPIVYLITPFAVLMPTQLTRYGAVMVVLLIKAFADVFAFPCNTILLTNSARDIRVLGTLNGVATSLSAIGRAIGPYAVGQTFSWSVDAGYVLAAFWLLALIALAGHITTWFLVEPEGLGEQQQHEEHKLDRVEILEDIDLETRVVADKAWLDSETTTATEYDSDGEYDSDSGIEDDAPLLSVGGKKSDL